ncbi:MAG: tRNA pseudouridine synthase B [Candidatus Parcubacteria bacterium]|nr:MAG: tRNA pseudouridine synthase B [Candidatus Parcubacteria bacterium]
MDGIVLFYKPENFYSTDVVNYFKKFTDKKVGHGGTLDKLAQGLLIIGIGNGTKYLKYFLNKSKKNYLAEIKFGYISETYDREGKLKFINNCYFDIEEIKKVIEKFRGKIKQQPPPFSAIKIKGKRAYKLARQNKEFEINSKEVYLYDYRIINYDPQKNILKIMLKVSSGFYVRSFANDLGIKLKCGAILWKLVREKINSFSINKALTFKDLENNFLEFKAFIKGKVQGVGFRYYCLSEAIRLKINGYVKNLDNGQVKVVAQGNFNSLINLYEKLKIGSKLSRVDEIIAIWQKPVFIYNNFEIF